MATFPLDEAGIVTLANDMSNGLQVHSDVFPNPPVDVLTLDNQLAAYGAARDEAVIAQAAAEEAIDKKQAALRALASLMKKNLRYAEVTVNFDDAKLNGIGWGGRRERQPLTAPGQAPNVISTEQGDDSITLTWDKPVKGGKVSVYKVMSQERGSDEDWKTEDVTTSRTITLTNQPTGKRMEYVVVAVNNAGDGPMSNVVRAVL